MCGCRKERDNGQLGILMPEGQDERLSHLLNAVIQTAGELEVGSSNATLSGGSLIHLENDMLWSFT